MNFVIWLLLIAAWYLVMRYRYNIYDLTWEWGWASKYLWGNGTITAIALAGMLLIGAGVAFPFGVFDDMDSSKPPALMQNGDR
jgi:hypothetical protein